MTERKPFGGGSVEGRTAIRTLIRTASRSLHRVMQDVTEEQARWVPPGTANPIANTYQHIIRALDGNLNGVILDRPMVYQRNGWTERFESAEPAHINRETVIGGTLDDIRAYHQDVNGALNDYLDGLTDADLGRMVETWRGPVTVADVLTLFMAFHTLQHLGEICTLKGIQGIRGFLF